MLHPQKIRGKMSTPLLLDLVNSVNRSRMLPVDSQVDYRLRTRPCKVGMEQD